MAANLFGRYVWLIDTLRRYKRLTFQEISELWQESGLGYGEELPLRTFHNHQKAIKDIFDVYIECDRKDGYRYYIDEPERLEGNNLQSWLISSYATLNQIQADNKLEDRIIFEDIPSGQTWLTPIAEATRRNRGSAVGMLWLAARTIQTGTKRKVLIPLMFTGYMPSTVSQIFKIPAKRLR